MTTYECLRCGNRLDLESGTAETGRDCPECGGPLRDIALPQE